MKKTAASRAAVEIVAPSNIPGAISNVPQTTKQVHKRHLAIYDGRDVLSHVIGDGNRWEARSPTGETIGTYETWHDAADAVSAEAA
jgi:hypothetical protein